MMRRRLRAPWGVREIPAGYVIETADGVPLVYVYAADEARLAGLGGNALTWDEAWRVARAIARLPDLLQAGTSGPGPAK